MPSDRNTSRAKGEIIRLRHAIERLQAYPQSLLISIDGAERGGPPGGECAQPLLLIAGEIAVGFAKLDAYMRAQQDATTATDEEGGDG